MSTMGPNLRALKEKKRMVKIVRDRMYCIYPTLENALEEVRSHYAEGEAGDEFIWTNIEMSEEEFNALPEFTGW